MTDDELTAVVGAMLGDEELKPLVPVYLPAAKSAVLSRLYPYDEDRTWLDVPPRYHHVAAEVCCYLVSKSGGEGEVRHVENGLTREWASASVPEAMLSSVTPYVGVPR